MSRRIALRIVAAALIAAVAFFPASRRASAQPAYVKDYQTVITLHDFGPNELGNPTAGLTMDPAGNLYGTESGGNGAVFELSPPPPGAPYKAWKETTLYTFKGGTDGFNTQTQLYRDAAGNLYGVTAEGGNTGCAGNEGCGTVFELSPPTAGQTNWTETILYRFTGGADGAYPGLENSYQLVTDAAGNLYGVTSDGTDAPCSNTGGCAGVFELSPPSQGQTAWTFKPLYNAGYNEIVGGLVLDAQGNLYGCFGGGAFKLSPPTAKNTAWTETDIASFGNYVSISGMVFDNSGNLYGTNYVEEDLYGTKHVSGVGDVYKLSPPTKGIRWSFNILAHFNGSDGNQPIGVPAFDGAGNLYGATVLGGQGNGTAYRLAPDGTLSVLHKFLGARDGSEPFGALLVDVAGNIYGTSDGGGPNGNGAVWEIPAPKN